MSDKPLSDEPFSISDFLSGLVSKNEKVNEKAVKIVYTNWRGETGVRRIIPKGIKFGANEWHPEPQWLLEALDIEKNADRAFALKDIHHWTTDTQGPI